jgi:hypothetical protein
MKENVFNKWPSSNYYAQLYSTLSGVQLTGLIIKGEGWGPNNRFNTASFWSMFKYRTIY